MTSTTEQELLDRVPTALFIGGEWVDSTSGDRIDVTDPSTGAVIARIASASAEDAVSALDAAADAAEEWAATAPRKRSDILRRAFDLVIERRDDFALLMTLEMGKPLAESDGEVTYGAEFLRWFSEEAVRITGRFGYTPERSGQMIVSQHPVGPCYLITPWNFPLAMATRKIGPALAAGCTMVVKPATATPLTTLYFAQVLAEAGLPPGVVNVITSKHAGEVSEPIISDPRLRKLSFTGSTEVGRSLLAQASQQVLRTSMELGGNAPFLVFDDADMEDAVAGALAAKFRNIGQACTAANRFIVHESIADEFVKRVTDAVSAYPIGRGTQAGVKIGPLINQDAIDKVEELVGDALERGATLCTGGHAREGEGTFYEGTVLDHVAPGTRLLKEEIFGPVLAVTRFSTEDEAIELANDTEFGLISYAFTRDLARSQRLIDRLESGMLGLNLGVISNASGPFGGIKQSGLGREGSAEGIHEYLETKYTLMPAPHV